MCIQVSIPRTSFQWNLPNVIEINVMNLETLYYVVIVVHNSALPLEGFANHSNNNKITSVFRFIFADRKGTDLVVFGSA